MRISKIHEEVLFELIMKNKNKQIDDEFAIDQSQYEIETDAENNSLKATKELEETETVPVDEKMETIHFPWAIGIIIGVLMLLIIACIIVIKVLEH